jgi:hypothetical protein
MRVLRWAGAVLIVLAIVFVGFAWGVVRREHRREVERIRYAHNRDYDAPFDPVNLVDPKTLSDAAIAWYMLAFCAGVPGLLCLLISFIPTGKRGTGPAAESKVR